MEPNQVKIAGWVFACVSVVACQSADVQGTHGYRAHEAEARNMRLVGYNDLQGRSAFETVIAKQGGRWIAYIGTHGGGAQPGDRAVGEQRHLDRGRDRPEQPKYLLHVPGIQAAGRRITGAQMVRICAGNDLPKGDPAKFYMMRADGNRARDVGRDGARASVTITT